MEDADPVAATNGHVVAEVECSVTTPDLDAGRRPDLRRRPVEVVKKPSPSRASRLPSLTSFDIFCNRDRRVFTFRSDTRSAPVLTPEGFAA